MKISNLEIRKRLTGSSKSKIKGGNKWSRFLKDPDTKKAYYCGIEKVCEDLQPPQQQQPQQYQQQPLIPAPSAYDADRPPMANIPQTSNIPPAPPLPPPAQIINNAVNNMSLKDVLKMNRKLNKGEKLNVKDEAELAKNDHMAILMKAVREGKKLKKVEKKEQVEKVGQPDARSIMMEALMKGKKLKKVVRQEKKVEEPSEMDELRQKLSLRRTQIKEEEGEVQPEEWGEGLWNRKGLFCWFRTANGKMFKVCVPPSRFKPFNPKRAGVKKPVKKMLVKKTTKKRPKEIKKVTNKTQVRKEVKRQLNKLPKNIIKQVPKNIIKEIENEVVEKAMEGLPTMKEFKKTMKKEKQQIKKEMEKLEKILFAIMKKSKKKEEPKKEEPEEKPEEVKKLKDDLFEIASWNKEYNPRTMRTMNTIKEIRTQLKFINSKLPNKKAFDDFLKKHNIEDDPYIYYDYKMLDNVYKMTQEAEKILKDCKGLSQESTIREMSSIVYNISSYKTLKNKNETINDSLKKLANGLDWLMKYDENKECFKDKNVLKALKIYHDLYISKDEKLLKLLNPIYKKLNHINTDKRNKFVENLFKKEEPKKEPKKAEPKKTSIEYIIMNAMSRKGDLEEKYKYLKEKNISKDEALEYMKRVDRSNSDRYNRIRKFIKGYAGVCSDDNQDSIRYIIRRLEALGSPRTQKKAEKLNELLGMINKAGFFNDVESTIKIDYQGDVTFFKTLKYLKKNYCNKELDDLSNVINKFKNNDYRWSANIMKKVDMELVNKFIEKIKGEPKKEEPKPKGKGLFLGSGLSGGDMSSQLLEDIRKGKKLRKSVQKEIIEKPNEIMSALKQKLKSIRKDVDDEDEDEIDYENDYDDEDEIDNEENEEEELKSIPTAPPLPDLLRKKVKLPELEMAEDKEELPELEEKNNKNLIYREMDLRTKFYTYENTKMYDNDDLLYKKKILDAPESYYSGGELYRNVKNDERNNDLRKKNIELLNQRNNYGFYKWFSVKVQ